MTLCIGRAYAICRAMSKEKIPACGQRTANASTQGQSRDTTTPSCIAAFPSSRLNLWPGLLCSAARYFMKRSGWLTLALAASLLPCPTLPCHGGEKVKTITGSYKQALRKAGEAGKPLMIDFYTDWCGWCKKLDTQLEM